jgi:RNA polymerase sigma-70 factor (ECF subfamily)
MATNRPTLPRAADEQITWLIDTYGATLYRVAVAILGDPRAAEDVVQEVLIKAWTSMPAWEGDVPIRWARTVTRNTALNALRATRNLATTPLDDDGAELPSSPAAEDVYERNEAVREMWAALERLDEDSRLLLVLHEVDGLTYEEIAATTDLTVSAVRSKLYRARLSLRGEVTR